MATSIVVQSRYDWIRPRRLGFLQPSQDVSSVFHTSITFALLERGFCTYHRFIFIYHNHCLIQNQRLVSSTSASSDVPSMSLEQRAVILNFQIVYMVVIDDCVIHYIFCVHFSSTDRDNVQRFHGCLTVERIRQSNSAEFGRSELFRLWTRFKS